MIIKNLTILTGEEAIIDIITAQRKAYAKKYIFAVVLLILGLFAITILAIQGNGIDAMVVSLLFIFLGLIFAAINTYNILTLRKKTIKNNQKILEYGISYTFIFREESFSLIIKSGSTTNKMEYSYFDLKKIIEREATIDFVFADNNYYSCKKDSFTSPKELEQFFYGLSKHKIKFKRLNK